MVPSNNRIYPNYSLPELNSPPKNKDIDVNHMDFPQKMKEQIGFEVLPFFKDL